ncbi:uncharacterized protein DEA37_0008520 [Paragonimus westermani]|uniref:Uncharacterized protein n=1 Tax=Paragonimus westermani TaxID=34504 RepID=A0A5J4N685_9TREM|nr:uncharacterized protein DEA37_0008520 [Paragonimus westermani]
MFVCVFVFVLVLLLASFRTGCCGCFAVAVDLLTWRRIGMSFCSCDGIGYQMV